MFYNFLFMVSISTIIVNFLLQVNIILLFGFSIYLGAESIKSVSHASVNHNDSMNNSLEHSSIISNESSSDVYQTVPMTLSTVVNQINNNDTEGQVISVQSEDYINRESDEDDELDASGEGIFFMTLYHLLYF